MVEFFYNEQLFIDLLELVFGVIIFTAIFKKTSGLRYLNFGRGVIMLSGVTIIIKEAINLSGIANHSLNELMTATTYLLFAVGVSLFYKKDVFRKYLEKLKPKRKKKEQP